MSVSRPQTEEVEYHGHPNYVMTWAILVVIFVISLIVGEMGNKALAITLIFGMAIIKAAYVLGNFMHIRYEPWIIKGMFALAILCMLFLYYGVMPDLHWVTLEVAP